MLFSENIVDKSTIYELDLKPVFEGEKILIRIRVENNFNVSSKDKLDE